MTVWDLILWPSFWIEAVRTERGEETLYACNAR